MQQWCGICNGYGAHDTAHHNTQGGFLPGDMAVIKDTVESDWAHLAGKRGRVEQVRGTTATVAIPGGAGGTKTISTDVKNLTPDV